MANNVNQGELNLTGIDHNKPKMTPLALMYLLAFYNNEWFLHVTTFQKSNVFHTRMSQLMLMEYITLDEFGFYAMTKQGYNYIRNLLKE